MRNETNTMQQIGRLETDTVTDQEFARKTEEQRAAPKILALSALELGGDNLDDAWDDSKVDNTGPQEALVSTIEIPDDASQIELFDPDESGVPRLEPAPARTPGRVISINDFEISSSSPKVEETQPEPNDHSSLLINPPKEDIDWLDKAKEDAQKDEPTHPAAQQSYATGPQVLKEAKGDFIPFTEEDKAA